KTKKKLDVAANIIISPSYTKDIALQIKKMLSKNLLSGIYHIANDGQCSWYEFATEIFKQAGISVRVNKKIETADSCATQRPLYSVLSSAKLPHLRTWQEALADYLKNRRKK
ncbi:MAG: hypothetical protein DRP78_07265, partial [Candidatus Omnitrophota bacterium]